MADDYPAAKAGYGYGPVVVEASTITITAEAKRRGKKSLPRLWILCFVLPCRLPVSPVSSPIPHTGEDPSDPNFWASGAYIYRLYIVREKES